MHTRPWKQYWWSGCLLLVVLGVSLLRPAVAHACSCVIPGEPDAERARSAAVFSGTVVAVDARERRAPWLQFSRTFPFVHWGQAAPINPELIDWTPTRVTFEVAQVWKGNITQQQTIFTGTGGGDCGYGFDQGQEYIVYAYEAGEKLATGICGRTQALGLAQADLAALGVGRPPADNALTEENAASSVAIVGLGALVVLIVGIVWLSVRRRVPQR